jgi:hypothetical protein
MSLISQTDPYEPEPLEDSPEEINKITELTASSTPYQSQMSSLAGKWYAEFVHEIGDAKIAKEVALIQLMVRHFSTERSLDLSLISWAEQSQ